MRIDPIVEEARRAGQNYVNSFKGDLQALVRDLQQRSGAEHRSVLSRSPKRPRTDPAMSATTRR